MGRDNDRREERALRRSSLIEEALAPDLTDEERSPTIAGAVEDGVVVPELDELLKASRATLYRYLHAYEQGGFEAPHANDLWIDDYSRYVPHSEWYLAERLPFLEGCFKKAVQAHGLPNRAYSDKGSIYEDARAFLEGLIEESDRAQKEALPGLHLAAMAETFSVVYSWTAFTEHLSSAPGRPFENYTETERTAAHQLWRDHGPLNRQWVQAALTRALASKGLRQHLSFYLDQIKLVHFNEAPSDGPEKPVTGRSKGAPNKGGARA